MSQFQAICIIAMTILLAWGTLNITYGLRAYHSGKIIERYFWRMNLYWGIMNFLLAGSTLLALNFNRLTVAQQTQLNVIAINIGLEVGYIFAGLAMATLHKPQLTQRRFGFGLSIAMQGTFLVIFDTTLFILLKTA